MIMMMMMTTTTTRLSSNLRPTTRECVHLVTPAHFRSRDKDGRHTGRSAIVENTMLHANFMALWSYCRAKIVEIRIFDPSFAPVTLTLTR